MKLLEKKNKMKLETSNKIRQQEQQIYISSKIESTFRRLKLILNNKVENF